MTGVVFANPFGEYVAGYKEGSSERLKQEQMVFQSVIQPALSAREKQLDRDLKLTIANKRAQRSGSRQSAQYAKDVQAQRDATTAQATTPTAAAAGGANTAVTAQAAAFTGGVPNAAPVGSLGFGALPTPAAGTFSQLGLNTAAPQAAPVAAPAPAAPVAAPVAAAPVPRSAAVQEAVANRYGEAGAPLAPTTGARFTPDGQLVRPISPAVPGNIPRTNRGTTFQDGPASFYPAPGQTVQQELFNFYDYVNGPLLTP